MHIQRLAKPDGRPLLLYARDAAPEGHAPPARRARRRTRTRTCAGIRCAANGSPTPAIASTAPSCRRPSPTRSRRAATRRTRPRCPRGRWDVAVFENLFPDVRAGGARSARRDRRPTARGRGVCEVVVFTQDPRTGARDAAAVARRAADRGVGGSLRRARAPRPTSQYVLPFENRGEEVGVTLHHPHGQIYALSVRAADAGPRAGAAGGAPASGTAAGCSRRWSTRELADGAAHDLRRAARRRVRAGVRALRLRGVDRAASAGAVALPRSTRRSARDFARALKTVLLKYDAAVGRPFPYMLVFHQAPTDGGRIPRRTCTPSSIRRTGCAAA